MSAQDPGRKAITVLDLPAPQPVEGLSERLQAALSACYARGWRLVAVSDGRAFLEYDVPKDAEKGGPGGVHE